MASEMKMRMTKLARSTFMILAIVMVFSACSSVKEKKSENEMTSPDNAQTEGSQPEAGSNPSNEATGNVISPLTNLKVESILSRPMMMMVENSPKARPQTGLNQADVVYEILAEGDITRYAAIFQSHQPKTIGPIRSIRPYYVQIGAAIDAIIVHAGWSQDAMESIVKLKVDHFDQVYGDGNYYWRDNTRKMPHNLYTNTEKILKGVQAKKIHNTWDGRGWNFSTESDSAATESGQSAQKITIPYIGNYTVSYEWDAQTNEYKRAINGKAHVDRETDEQLTANNILVCEAMHRTLDEKFRREVDVQGPGHGWLIQKGKIIEVQWQMKDGLVRAFDASGIELPMQVGKTWIQFVPKKTSIAWK